MKAIICVSALAIFTILLFADKSFSEDAGSADKIAPYQNVNELQANKAAVGDMNNDGKLNTSDMPANNGDLTAAGNVEAGGLVKGIKGICVGNDCKSKWPILKCSEYEERPPGENGDNYCASIGKVCTGVFLGSGVSYFNECSAIPKGTHRTRCCWVE